MHIPPSSLSSTWTSRGWIYSKALGTKIGPPRHEWKISLAALKCLVQSDSASSSWCLQLKCAQQASDATEIHALDSSWSKVHCLISNNRSMWLLLIFASSAVWACWDYVCTTHLVRKPRTLFHSRHHSLTCDLPLTMFSSAWIVRAYLALTCSYLPCDSEWLHNLSLHYTYGQTS